MLIKGSKLSPAQRSLVLAAFPYRWTHENKRRAHTFYGGHVPTMEPVSDEQWLADHAFHFIKDGSRLMANRHHAEPAYMAG